MKTKSLVLAVAVALALAGCGGGDATRNDFSVDIPSAGGVYDGDITYDAVLGTYSLVTTATEDNVFVGIVPNPLNPLSDIESRGFLTFSLSQIPGGASIASAWLAIRINDVYVDSGTSVSVRPAMVSFGSLSGLSDPVVINYFNNAEIVVGPVSYDVFPGDIGADVMIDVTDPVIRARNNGFSTVQIKLFGSFGRIVIDDLTSPPRIEVDYVLWS